MARIKVKLQEVSESQLKSWQKFKQYGALYHHSAAKYQNQLSFTFNIQSYSLQDMPHQSEALIIMVNGHGILSPLEASHQSLSDAAATWV